MTEEQWYWNLKQGRAVPASERGPADDLMGPYDSKDEAERWRERLDERNEQWEQADREWAGEEEEG
jgi:hypothetical protein